VLSAAATHPRNFSAPRCGRFSAAPSFIHSHVNYAVSQTQLE
jgi:hypothetical protein